MRGHNIAQFCNEFWAGGTTCQYNIATMLRACAWPVQHIRIPKMCKSHHTQVHPSFGLLPQQKRASFAVSVGRTMPHVDVGGSRMLKSIQHSNVASSHCVTNTAPSGKAASSAPHQFKPAYHSGSEDKRTRTRVNRVFSSINRAVDAVRTALYLHAAPQLPHVGW